MKSVPVFKSEAGRERILAVFRSQIGRIPVPVRERTLATSFGETYLLEAGREEDPPVFLFHGSCSNSAMWIGDIAALSGSRHVLCVDILGEAGNSAPNRPDLASDVYARWVGEILDALEMPSADFIGNSLGGWLALQFATRHPERVSRLVLLAPSGIVPIRLSFIVRSIYHASRGRKGIETLSRLIYGEDDIPREAVETSWLIMENYNPILGALPVYTDAQLGRLSMPVLYIAGEDDVTVDTRKAAERLKRLVPQTFAVRLPNNGHVVIGTMDRVVPFLTAGVR